MKNGNQFFTVPLKFAQPELAGRSFFVKVTGAAMRNVARHPKKHLLLLTISEDLKSYQVLWGGEGINSKPTSEFINTSAAIICRSLLFSTLTPRT
jgi:hypothetical protein